ncbi:MAG: hypothetical protein ACLPKB_11800 [Xanthobacteraceae bacterium]
MRRPHRLLRRIALYAGAAAGIAVVGFGALWWRLGSGPIALDVATPWLTAAIEENFGSGHRVEVGGTQIERDESGRTAVRIRDIVVRDSGGRVVASAPKAEVALSGSSLLTGHMRAERLSLVGATLKVRIEPDGRATVFAGGDSQPLATAAAKTTAAPSSAPAAQGGASAPVRTADAGIPAGPNNIAALLGWIDGLSASGLDGYELRELGLKGGSLTVDDQRSGKRWVFDNIDVSLTHPHHGGIAFRVSSDNRQRPWSLTAAVTPTDSGRRVIQIDASKVSTKDILLAARVGEPQIEADVPISAALRAEIGPDGTLEVVEGKVVAENGEIFDPHSSVARMALERAEFNVQWDANRRTLTVPFQIVAGGNRLTLVAQVDAPRESDPAWRAALTGGTVFLAGSGKADDPPLVLNRILVRMHCDPDKRQLWIDDADVGNMEMGIFAKGAFDYSGDPRLAVQMAGSRMTAGAMKRLWPIFVQPELRAWVIEHISGGAIETITLASNAPVRAMIPGGPPMEDSGTLLDLKATGASLRPFEELPGIEEADLEIHATGRTAIVKLGRGSINLPSGRKLTMSGGTFEVPDNLLRPIASRTRFRLEGPVPAAAELLAMDFLRDSASATPVDPATSRGTFSAQVALGIPLGDELPKGAPVDYGVTIDLSNFAADKMVMGQKIEAQALKVLATSKGFEMKGDAKINGSPAVLDYHKANGEDADVRIQANLDDAARKRLGFDLGAAVAGPISTKVTGRLAANGENRFAIEADLTQAKIDNLLPGWQKAAGKSARANFTMVSKSQSTTRIDDLVIDGSGVAVKGAIELDSSGDLLNANFPVYSVSDNEKANDRASLKAERATDGTLRVTMRGDSYDGRGFIKSALGGGSAAEAKKKPHGDDLDLDIKLGAVVGFNGELIRGLDLRMSRRAGEIRSFSLKAKLGRDTPFTGDLQGRAGRQMISFDTNDAGALFRFTDFYPRVYGGRFQASLDSTSSDQQGADGVLEVRDFAVRGEAALDSVASGAPGSPHSGVEFSLIHVDFNRAPGRLTINGGVVKGTAIGGEIESGGIIDYVQNDMHLRGTIIPVYGLNNLPNAIIGEVPVFGDVLGGLLGGKNSGLVAVSFDVVGPPSHPNLRFYPGTVFVPGVFKQILSAPTMTAPPTSNSFADPTHR